MALNLLIAALGATVRIDLDGLTDADAAAVREAWRDALAVAPVPERVEGPTVVPTASADRAAMLQRLSQQVTLAVLEHRRGDLVMLHAAGIAADDGRVVVLVGPSGRGKTTAARTLGARFGYVSDETIAIDDEGRVWPYRKPLSVIERQGAPKAERSPSELGLRPLPDAALRLAAIVLLDRRDDAGERAVIEHVDLGDALEDLVAQSSYLAAMPAPLRTISALADATGGIRRVTYRDAASLHDVIDHLLSAGAPAQAAPAPAPAGRVVGEADLPADPPVAEADLPAGRVVGEAAPAPAGRVVGEADVSRPPEPGDTPSPRYSRTPYHDALELADPDRLALLHVDARGEGTVRVLGGIAPAVWRAADTATIDELVAAAVAAYGAAPDADPCAHVIDAVDALVAAGALALVAAGPERWRIRDDVAWTDSGDRVVALALSDQAASPRALEGSAAAVWRALDRTDAPEIDGIAAELAETFDADAALVRADVVTFLAQLRDEALVEVVS